MESRCQPPSPFLKANCLSRLFFWWLNSFFSEGYKRDLEICDLYETLPDDKAAELGDLLAAEWSKECEWVSKTVKLGGKGQRAQTPSLARVISRVFARRFALVGLLALVEECVLRIAQPVSLGLLIRYFSNRDEYEEYVGYLAAFGVFFSAFLYVFTHHPYFFGVCHIGMQVRVACCSLVYRKSLKLSQASMRETTIGQMVNLLSNDVNRFDESAVFLHYLWIGPIQTLGITGLLWMYLGPSCLIGLAILVLFVPFQGYLGKQFSKLRAATAIRTDKRIRIMNEIVSGIRVIKMYAWEHPFSKLVDTARKHEIKYVRRTSYLRALNMSLFFTSSKIIVFLSFLLFVLLGNHLTAEKVFVTLALYNNVRLVMTLFFPSAVAILAETKVSIKRLQEFLLQEEQPSKIVEDAAKQDTSEIGIALVDVCAKWYPEQSDNSLDNIHLTIRSGQLFCIIGHVGAGKSSTLHVILKELPVTEGKVDVNGTIAYVAQEPWLFTGSVRENILFGKRFDAEWYHQVVEACALRHDFKLLPHGDSTLIGDKGSTLSGGQKARIALARAVYFNADIYLLDDPLSAVDAEVGQHLFSKCINGILSQKVRILVTHQLQFLRHVHQILLLEDGEIKERGTYDELARKGINFEQIIAQKKEELTPKLSKISHTAHQSISLIETYRPRSASIPSLGSGESVVKITYGVVSVASASDNLAPEEIPLVEGDKMAENKSFVPKEVDENVAHGSVRWTMYYKYFHAGSNFFCILAILILSVICQFFYTGSDYWLNIWTTAEELRAKNITVHPNPNDPLYYVYHDRNVQLYGYATIVGLLFITSWIRTLLFFLSCMKSSVNLHKNMFEGIIRSPVLFFETNPAGRILNRFSKDMGQIDDALPPTFFDAFAIFLNVWAIIIVIAVVNPVLLAPVFVLCIIFSLLRRFYIRTARSVKRLEGIARSPVFSHISTSLNGLTTIRAFRAEQEFTNIFHKHQDLHSSSWFLFLCSTRWFGIWLDWISVTFIGVVAFSFLLFARGGAEVGLAVSSAMMLTGMFQWGIRQSAEVENQMVSVERVMQYAQLESEATLESPYGVKPSKEWPEEGEIVFDHMHVYYDLNPVLNDINITINGGEKVGIVGRTGAGKSTLITALFRMVEPSGRILIDGVNILDIGLHDLRSKISIIPQEPVLFSGTLRKNLDPFENYSDADLWSALEESHLAKDIRQLDLGLNVVVSEGGTNFSLGQRQLLCLARAILRNNKVLVLDEATANVDLNTDALIQNTIRTKFKGCTVLTVAHRLHTVMDCDRLMILEAGNIMEFDEPIVLLQNTNGFLRKLVAQTGDTTAKDLEKQAKRAHDSRLRTSRN